VDMITAAVPMKSTVDARLLRLRGCWLRGRV
jgi:hypothetical protein